MVTHNEMFLHTLAERLVVFQNGDIEIFDGSYQEFLEKGGWHDEKPPTPNSRSNESLKTAHAKLAKKELRRKRSDVIARRSQTIKPLEKRANRLEKDIESREVELNHLNHSMQQASQDQDGSRISELSQSIHACQSAMDRLFEELEKVTDEIDSRNAVFDQELRQLDDVRT
jgi:ATP-binding cassette subfamily F protein 3